MRSLTRKVLRLSELVWAEEVDDGEVAWAVEMATNVWISFVGVCVSRGWLDGLTGWKTRMVR